MEYETLHIAFTDTSVSITPVSIGDANKVVSAQAPAQFSTTQFSTPQFCASSAISAQA